MVECRPWQACHRPSRDRLVAKLIPSTLHQPLSGQGTASLRLQVHSSTSLFNGQKLRIRPCPSTSYWHSSSSSALPTFAPTTSPPSPPNSTHNSLLPGNPPASNPPPPSTTPAISAASTST